MKKTTIFIIAVITSIKLFSQSPDKMSYQAVIRDASNQLIVNSPIGMQISIIQGSASGTVVYSETQTPNTNGNGLLNIEIGGDPSFASIDWSDGPYFIKTETDPEGGTNYTITGTSQFLSVPYALHAKTAESISGSIPESDPIFANWDKTSGINIYESQIIDLEHFTNSDETDPIFSASISSNITAIDTANWNNKLTEEVDGSVTNEIQGLSSVLTEDNNAGNTKITNLANPENNQDAATKAYVDALEEQMRLMQNTILGGGYAVDYEGNIYNTVTIGTQTWMAENLKSTKYNDGTDIPLVIDTSEWVNLTTDAYCWVYNVESNTEVYGLLYNWQTVETGKLCPVGWHAPTDAEWYTLADFLGGNEVAGGKLKEAGYEHWFAPNTGATNESGFTAIAAGSRIYGVGYFNQVGYTATFWTSSENGSSSAWARAIDYNVTNCYPSNAAKSVGLSVRCIKD